MVTLTRDAVYSDVRQILIIYNHIELISLFDVKGSLWVSSCHFKVLQVHACSTSCEEG